MRPIRRETGGAHITARADRGSEWQGGEVAIRRVNCANAVRGIAPIVVERVCREVRAAVGEGGDCGIAFRKRISCGAGTCVPSRSARCKGFTAVCSHRGPERRRSRGYAGDRWRTNRRRDGGDVEGEICRRTRAAGIISRHSHNGAIASHCRSS